MDITPTTNLLLPARSFFKASRKKDKVLPSISIPISVETTDNAITDLGDLVVSPNSI